MNPKSNMPGAIVTEDYIVKAKEPEVEVPEVSIGRHGFQKFKEHANRELFVSFDSTTATRRHHLINKIINSRFNTRLEQV